MAKVLQIYKGVMTYNKVYLVKNGTKKMFTGFIKMADEHGNENSYKMNSFRSQIIIQSEAIGERGMAGKNVEVHGEFKQNTWQGETNWELMAEKIFIEGYEQLAIDAEAADYPMPTPPGIMQPSQQMQPAYVQQNQMPTMPSVPNAPNIQVPSTYQGPANASETPKSIPNGFVYKI